MPFFPDASPLNTSYKKLPINSPSISPSNIPRGAAAPNVNDAPIAPPIIPPITVPIVLNKVFPKGSPDKIDVTATIIGPITGIGIFPAAAFMDLNISKLEAIFFAVSGPNNFVMNLPGALSIPLLKILPVAELNTVDIPCLAT